MRVGIVSFMHESNTFIAQPTTFDNFRSEVLLTGEAIRERFAGGHHEVSGFFEGLAAEAIEAASILMAWATPAGAITADALQRVVAMLFEGLDAAGPLDGLLVAPHGAAVSERERDMDGHWLTLLRRRVGPNVPIICTLDAHANVSPRMLAACDATVVYRTNPHLDQKARGLEAARLMARTLRREVRPTQAGAFPGVAINIERQRTDEPPCRPMYELADTMLRRPGVLSNSVVLGFPYADVEEMGSGFIVVTDDDPELARRLAGELAAWLVEHRHDFVGRFIGVDEALREAASAPASQAPVCLLDMGDNVGGGAPGDGTILAHAIEAGALRGEPAFVCLCDPAAADEARRAGVGAHVRLRMGGRTDALHGPPLQADVTVRSLHDGRFTEPQPRHGGMTQFDMGPTAVVETDARLTVMLTTRRAFPVSLVQLTSCGLDPRAFRVLMAKGVQAPVTAYSAVCPRLIRVNTPGSTSADMQHFSYQHRRRPLFPFEEIAGAAK